jgi:hypothetical protein
MRTVVWAVLMIVVLSPLSFTAEPCDAKCKVQTVIDKNVGIPLDRPLTLEILRKFAPVVRETATKVANDWQNHTVHVFEYAGLVVSVLVRPDNSIWVQTIDLKGGNYRMAYGIKLGKIAGPDIDAVLGPPAETRRDAGRPVQWIYTNFEQTEVLTFHRTDDTLVGVHWDFTPGD